MPAGLTDLATRPNRQAMRNVLAINADTPRRKWWLNTPTPAVLDSGVMDEE